MNVYEQVAEKLREKAYTAEELETLLQRPKGSINSALHYFAHHRRFQLHKQRVGPGKICRFWLEDGVSQTEVLDWKEKASGT